MDEGSDNQETLNTGQPKITGYRHLSNDDVALINTIKAVGNQVRDLVFDIETQPFVDHRWAAIAKTNLQIGFMALTRAVAQPTSF